MKKLVAPLVLLSSIMLLTSCGESNEEVPVVTPIKEAPAPITQDGTPSPKIAGNSTWSQEFVHTEIVAYPTPAGDDHTEFSVTIADGVITAASASEKSHDPVSNQYQIAFAKELAGKVVGKKADGLKLDSIAGATLTTVAFEQYVASVK